MNEERERERWLGDVREGTGVGEGSGVESKGRESEVNEVADEEERKRKKRAGRRASKR